MPNPRSSGWHRNLTNQRIIEVRACGAQRAQHQTHAHYQPQFLRLAKGNRDGSKNGYLTAKPRLSYLISAVYIIAHAGEAYEALDTRKPKCSENSLAGVKKTSLTPNSLNWFSESVSSARSPVSISRLSGRILGTVFSQAELVRARAGSRRLEERSAAPERS